MDRVRGLTELRVVRGWWNDPGLLPAVRTLATYDDNRATGYLYGDGKNWPPPLAGYGPRLADALYAETGLVYPIVAFQAYRDGTGCGWHTDTAFDAQAILSLGVTRTFAIRASDIIDEQRIQVADGDLLVMPSGFQLEWEHCVPVEDVPGERISLVFRTVRRS